MNIRKWFEKSYRLIKSGAKQVDNLGKIATDDYIQRRLMEHPKYADPKKLGRYSFQVHSQNYEDGIISEIFNRIGTTSKTFVEFGVENGLECNTANLLYQGWSGAWLEADRKAVKQINTKFRSLIRTEQLKIKKAMINAENIESLFTELIVLPEIDLLSIDIDGNDYWVWKAIQNFRPRVVIIEYNAKFPPGQKWVRSYDASAIWNDDLYYGASLESLVSLGAEKGYKLVGCDFTGTNAFFVLDDLVEDKFFPQYTAKAHYEPPRFFLKQTIGHRRGFGKFENI